ncbi:MAG: hypothetical protein MI924_17370 [Chloroflexales bacterium]|nr:hypothetical protein [Chloroflexales bacterium]
MASATQRIDAVVAPISLRTLRQTVDALLIEIHEHVGGLRFPYRARNPARPPNLIGLRPHDSMDAAADDLDDAADWDDDTPVIDEVEYATLPRGDSAAAPILAAALLAAANALQGMLRALMDARS